ncbi:MAG: hypothetical protein ACJA1Y_001710, partial [Burkholderiaceae bacterium]
MIWLKRDVQAARPAEAPPARGFFSAHELPFSQLWLLRPGLLNIPNMAALAFRISCAAGKSVFY